MGGHAMMTGSVLKNLKCYYCMYVYLVWTIWDSRVRTFPHFSNPLYCTTSFSTPPSPSPSHQGRIRQKDNEPFSGWSFLLRPTRAFVRTIQPKFLPHKSCFDGGFDGVTPAPASAILTFCSDI